jgi:glycosyltransferase involved in cell wall biosynthesis
MINYSHKTKKLDSCRISVIIPLFNKSDYVIESIESVLRQSSSAEEIIIIDDGSTDGSVDTIIKAGLDKFVKIHLQKNAGVSAARNKGIAIATGEFVAFLDADDRFSSDYIKTIRMLAKHYPQAHMLCTGYTRFWPNGHTASCTLQPNSSFEQILIDDFYSSWSQHAFTFTSAIAARRSVMLQQNIMFPIGERLGEDQDVWFRLCEAGPTAYANTPAVEYRMAVAGSATNQSIITDLLPCYQRLEQRIRNELIPAHLLYGAKKLLSAHLINVARARINIGDIDGAISLLHREFASIKKSYWTRTMLLAGRKKIARKFIGH